MNFPLRATATVVLGTALSFIASFPATVRADEHAAWTYEGATGPENWGKLSPDNVMCGIGRNQAPINIAGALDTAEQPLQPRFAAGSKQIVNNGHTIQVDFEPGNTLVVDGVTFEVKQVHFHAPAETQIAGQSFPLEAHIVLADADGNLIVLALLFKEGEANGALAKIWSAMPKKPGPASPLANAVTPMAFMPKSMSYYRFSASLTTPPCSEGVRWLVLKSPATVSKAQVEAFEHTMGHHNNRPLQPLNGRVVVD